MEGMGEDKGFLRIDTTGNHSLVLIRSGKGMAEFCDTYDLFVLIGRVRRMIGRDEGR